jgi:hypothetical protein
MVKSADLGSVDAKVRIAFARLTGVYFEQVPFLVGPGVNPTSAQFTTIMPAL